MTTIVLSLEFVAEAGRFGVRLVRLEPVYCSAGFADWLDWLGPSNTESVVHRHPHVVGERLPPNRYRPWYWRVLWSVLAETSSSMSQRPEDETERRKSPRSPPTSRHTFATPIVSSLSFVRDKDDESSE